MFDRSSSRISFQAGERSLWSTGRILLKRDLPAALLVCHRLRPYYSGRWDLRGSSDELALFFLSGMSSSGKSKRIILRRLLSCRSVTVIYTINSVKHKIVGFKVPMISGLLHSIVFTIAEPAPIFSNTNRRWRQKFSLSRPRVLCLGPSCASGSSVIALCSYRGLWQMWCWPLPWES